MPHFKVGDTVVVFNPQEPDRVQTSKIVAVSKAKYGTPKVKLQGSLKFDWWADGTCCTPFNGGRRLLSPEDVPTAQTAVRKQQERTAVVKEISDLFRSTEGAIHANLRWMPDLEAIRRIALGMQTKLEGER